MKPNPPDDHREENANGGIGDSYLSDTVNELLQLAELALEQKSFVEARTYLKMAMLRDEDRAEPCFWLSELYESRGDVREALHYFCRAFDAGPSFQPTRVNHCSP